MVIFGLSRPDVNKLKREGNVTGLIEALDHRNLDVRRDAKRALLELGEGAAESLVANIMYNDSEVRREAAEILGEIKNLGIVVIRGGLVKIVNSAAVKLSGYSKREIEEKQFVDFIAPEYEEIVLTRYKKRLMAEKIPNVYEVEILSKTGEKIPVEISASLIKYEDRPANLAFLRDLRAVD
jgi:PAS domain S-box-containing protein